MNNTQKSGEISGFFLFSEHSLTLHSATFYFFPFLRSAQDDGAFYCHCRTSIRQSISQPAPCLFPYGFSGVNSHKWAPFVP